MFDKIKQILKFQVPLAFARAEVIKDGSDIYLYGVIGDEITAGQVVEAIKASKGDLDIHLFSRGGDLFVGSAIYGILKQYPGEITIYVEGLAASSAAYIAMAADTIVMEASAMMMIHNAWTIAAGNHNELRQEAELIEKQQNAMVQAFVDKTGKDRDDILALMDEETWMDAQEAVAQGFADDIYTNENKVAASVDPDEVPFKHIPNQFISNQQTKSDMKLSDDILKALNLNSDASDKDVHTAILNLAASGKRETADEEHDENQKAEAQNEVIGNLEANINSLQKRLDEKEKAEQSERAETYINSAIEQGKINPSDKDAWLNSARADFDETKKILDERKVNSAMPGKVKVDGENSPSNGDETKVNANQECADFLRAQMNLGKTGS